MHQRKKFTQKGFNKTQLKFGKFSKNRYLNKRASLRFAVKPFRILRRRHRISWMKYIRFVKFPRLTMWSVARSKDLRAKFFRAKRLPITFHFRSKLQQPRNPYLRSLSSLERRAKSRLLIKSYPSVVYKRRLRTTRFTKVLYFVRRLSSRLKARRTVQHGVMWKPRLSLRTTRRLRRFNDVVRFKRRYLHTQRTEKVKRRRVRLLSFLIGKDRDRIRRKLLRLRFPRLFYKLSRRAPFPNKAPSRLVGAYFRKSRMLVRRYRRRVRQSKKFLLRKFFYHKAQDKQLFKSLPYISPASTAKPNKEQLFFIFDRAPEPILSNYSLSSQYLPLNVDTLLVQHSPIFTDLWSELLKTFGHFYTSEPSATEPGHINWFNCSSSAHLTQYLVTNVVQNGSDVVAPTTSQPSRRRNNSLALRILVSLVGQANPRITQLNTQGLIWTEMQTTLKHLKGLDTAVEVSKLSIALNKLNLERKARNLTLSCLSAEFVPHEFWKSNRFRFNLETGSRELRGFWLPKSTWNATPKAAQPLVAEVWFKEDTWNWSFSLLSLPTLTRITGHPSLPTTAKTSRRPSLPFSLVLRERLWKLMSKVVRGGLAKPFLRLQFRKPRPVKGFKSKKRRKQKFRKNWGVLSSALASQPSLKQAMRVWRTYLHPQDLRHDEDVNDFTTSNSDKLMFSRQLRGSSKGLLQACTRLTAKASLLGALRLRKNIRVSQRWRRRRPGPVNLTMRRLKQKLRRIKGRRIRSLKWKNRRRNLSLLKNTSNGGKLYSDAIESLAVSLTKTVGSDVTSLLNLRSPTPAISEQLITPSTLLITQSNLVVLKYLLFAPMVMQLKSRKEATRPSVSTLLEAAAVRLQNQLSMYHFESRARALLSSNITQISKTSIVFRRKLVRLVSHAVFTPRIIIWYYKAFVHFAEICTGRQVAVTFGPFAENGLTVEDLALCYNWDIRLLYFQRLLGHRIFANEGLRLTALSLRLKDPHFLANWLRGMLKRMSFWKYRLLFRYLKFILKYLLIPKAAHFGIKGFKLKLKGKISVAGNARTRTLFQRLGYTSHSQFSNKIAYDLSYINTFTGVMGFQIWFFY